MIQAIRGNCCGRHAILRVWIAVVCMASSSHTFLLKRPPPQRTTTTRLSAIEFDPSTISLNDVSLQYPVTLARRLFSSEPRREFAVRDVSCEFGPSEIVLLRGASQSGKSTLMKMIMGEEQPTSGSVNLGPAIPTMLAAVYHTPAFDNKRTAQQILEQQARLLLEDEGECSEVAAEFGKLIIDSTSWSQTPSQMTTSENYRLRLAEACIRSSLEGGADLSSAVPAPVILLDEWMDKETSASSSKVEQALLHLVQETGAVVFCATHKPNLWKRLTKTTPQTSQLFMFQGEIMSLDQERGQ